MTIQITDLPQRGVLTVRGQDAKTFLQGQLTCDMNTITSKEAQLGAQCNLQGRVHSLFTITQAANTDEPTYYLMMPMSLVPIAQAGLKKYALFSKVTLEPLENICALGILGEYNNDNQTNNNPHPFWSCAVPSAPNQPRFEVYGSIDQIEGLKQALMLSLQAELISPADWEEHEINSKYPEIVPETSDQFLPHHIGMVEWGGVSFEKGCYLGQEIVARMQWRGNIKKHLRKATVTTQNASKPGDKLWSNAEQQGDPVGQILRVVAKGDDTLLLYVANDDAVVYSGDGLIATP